MNSLPYPHRQKQLLGLIQKLELPENSPIQWALLDRALTHSTVSSTENYEQLEFVGDAVVRLAAAQFLLENYPDASVGEFTAIRSVLVSDRALAKWANSYNLERYLLLSNSAAADKTGRESRMAAAYEALLGALYLSTNTLALVRPWLDRHFQQLTLEIQADPARQNYKAALQEWTQARHKQLPEYRVQETSQFHADTERFTAEVWFQGQFLGQGKGRSIKVAEQAAAKVAFASLISKPDLPPAETSQTD